MEKKFTILKTVVILITFLGSHGSIYLYAQTDSSSLEQTKMVDSPNGGSQKVLLPGFASTRFQYNNTKGIPSTNSFSPVGIVAFPLVKVNDHLFLDGGVQFLANSDGSTSASIGELVVYYRINPWMSAFLGNFSPHYGLYLGIFDDFTNRFGTGVAPVGMGHGLQNQNGVGLQGALQVGYSKLAYQVYIANGPQLTVDSITAGSANLTGQLSYASFTDNNKNKSYGWHIGYLPFSNSCLELVFSGEYAPKTGNQNTAFQNVSNTSWAVGMNYYHTFNPIMVRFLAEYNQIQIQNVNYYLYDSAHVKSAYTFNNSQNGWFTGMTLRDVGATSKFVSSLELAGRVGAYNPPKDALWGGNRTDQTTVCLTYWLTWAIPINLEYDVLTQSGSPTQKIFTSTVYFRF